MNISALKNGAARCCILGFAALMLSPTFAAATDTAPPATQAHYSWHNVKIGGGGYVPAILYSPVQQGLAFLRSDMGGVYRWDTKTQSWIGLQDGDPEWNLRGVESVALDPKDANTLYAAVGAYRRLPAAIIRSHDLGKSWQITRVPFRMGGNEEGRGMGERLAIDPNNTSTLYFGSRYDGLQISTDKGATWHKVESFPLKGLGTPPADARPHGGLSFVLFDPQSGKDGAGSQTIYVGNADPGPHHLYVSHDGGKSWAAVDGGPAADLNPQQAALDENGMLTLTYADGMGPYNVSRGAVWRLDTKNATWTDVTPDKINNPAFAGLSVVKGTVAVSSLYRKGGDDVWYSRDGGAHWTALKDISKRDVTETPFLKWGGPEANFGWWLTGLAIDPFAPDHITYTTGATIYTTTDLGKPALTWRPWVEGVEQTAVISLASPAAGPHLISGLGDIGGFTHGDLSVSPTLQEHPIFTNVNVIDYAEKAPNVLVRSGTYHWDASLKKPASLAYSEDSGKSWQPLYAPYPAGYQLPKEIGYNFGDAYIDASIAVSAEGKCFIVMTQGPVRTCDRGTSWDQISGIAKNGHPVADRMDAKTFYAVDFAGGRILISTDEGKSFRPQKTVGLPKDIRSDEPGAQKLLPDETPPRETPWPLVAAPGARGDLWFLSEGRLFHSRDGGKHFVALPAAMKVKTFTFGKASVGKTHPALFALGTLNDTFAIWRSDDEGKSWLRVNDAQHEYARTFRAIAADKRIFGRVYVGTDGRGIIYGEPVK